MDPDEATKVLQEHINKSIDAKILPITEMVAGLNMAFVSLIGALHDKGALPVEDAELALKAVLERLNDNNKASQSAETLRRLISGCEWLRRGVGPAQH